MNHSDAHSEQVANTVGCAAPRVRPANSDPGNDLLAEQVDYYRARADEYDDWWLRRGRYALPDDLASRWFEDVAQAEAALHEFAPTGRVLELACGTGLWTRHLAGHARHVTAVDASPEVIEHNRRRLASSPVDVEYVVADVFGWLRQAATAYDVVMFTYWFVPRSGRQAGRVGPHRQRRRAPPAVQSSGRFWRPAGEPTSAE